MNDLNTTGKKSLQGARFNEIQHIRVKINCDCIMFSDVKGRISPWEMHSLIKAVFVFAEIIMPNHLNHSEGNGINGKP